MAKRIISLMMVVALSMSMFMLVGCESFDLDKYKEDKKAEIESYATSKGEENYNEIAWQRVIDIVTSAKVDIDLAVDKTELDKKFESAKKSIDEVNSNKAMTGKIYDLQEAFDNGFVTHADLESIAQQVNNNETLDDVSDSIETAVRKTYLEKVMSWKTSDGSLKYPDATIEGVDHYKIYWRYNGCVAVRFWSYTGDFPAWMQTETVDGIDIIYSGPKVQIWVID